MRLPCNCSKDKPESRAATLWQQWIEHLAKHRPLSEAMRAVIVQDVGDIRHSIN